MMDIVFLILGVVKSQLSPPKGGEEFYLKIFGISINCEKFIGEGYDKID